MKSGKMLKVFSILIILVGAFGIITGIWGFIDTSNTRKAQEAERAQTETQLSQLEKETAILKAKKVEYQADIAALIQNKAIYESDKAAYDMLKAAYDAKAAEFKTEKDSGHLNNESIAETQSILDAGALKLEAGKAKLIEYETEQTFVDNYKAEQGAVDAGLAQLSADDSVTSKLKSGMSQLDAVKEAFQENTVKEKRQLSAVFYLCTVCMIIAVFAIFAAIKGLAGLKSPDNGSIKDGLFLGLVSLILAIAACAFGVMNGFTEKLLLSSAIVCETIFALLFVIAVFKFKDSVIIHNKST